MTENKFTCSAADPSNEWSTFDAARWLYSKAWAEAKLRLMYSLVLAERETSAVRQSEMSVGNGGETLDLTSIGTN